MTVTIKNKEPNAPPVQEILPANSLVTDLPRVNDIKTPNQAIALMKTLAAEVGKNYLEQGGTLLKLKEFTNGDTENFRDLCEKILGYKYRKAQYLMGIFEFCDIAKLKWEQIEEIGWTKLRLVQQFVKDPTECAPWLKKAGELTFEKLEIELRQDFLPINTTTKVLKFYNPYDPEAVQMAVDEVKKATGFKSDASALALICTDYTANFPFNSLRVVTALQEDGLKSLLKIDKPHNENFQLDAEKLVIDFFRDIGKPASVKLFEQAFPATPANSK